MTTRQIHYCLRCGHEWLSSLERPAKCAKCGDANWDRERILPRRAKTPGQKRGARQRSQPGRSRRR